VICTLGKRPSIFMKETHPSSRKMLYKDDDRKDSADKNVLVMSLKNLGAKTN
jgi:hypothetical protein